MGKQVLKRVAYHEAGHAVAAFCTGADVYRVVVDADEAAAEGYDGADGGVALAYPPSFSGRPRAVAEIAVSFAGVMAEKRALHRGFCLRMAGTARSDMAAIEATVADWPEADREALRQDAMDALRLIFRHAWPAVCVLADFLQTCAGRCNDFHVETACHLVRRPIEGVPFAPWPKVAP